MLTRRGRVVLPIVLIAALALLTWNADLLRAALAAHAPSLRTAPADALEPDANTITPAPDAIAPAAPAADPDIVDQPLTPIGPYTVIPDGAHTPGFTLFENIYLRRGVLYVVARDAGVFPPVADMISAPYELGPDVDTTPTSQEMQFLRADEVESVLGKHAIRIEGLSVVVYDPPQFMTHLYHWWGEIILGAWRILSFEGEKTNQLPMPRRFLLPFSAKGAFRDPAGVDAPLMRAAWPGAQIEEADWWADLIALDATAVFDRVMLVNRPATHRHPLGSRWNKMIAGTMDVPAPDGFWEPLRRTIVANLLGHDGGAGEAPATPTPLVTYVSRQRANSRRLRVEDHDALVRALRGLEEAGVCVFREARMEEMSLKEQVELAARSTIIIGVHGNGLTHQLWMPASYRSAVFEIFDPEGYFFDYEMLARNMGHRHYAVWNDRLVTYPKGTYHDGINSGEHFHGKNIPVDAGALAQAVKERLAEVAP